MAVPLPQRLDCLRILGLSQLPEAWMRGVCQTVPVHPRCQVLDECRGQGRGAAHQK
jgi:hypothetical protein